MDLDPTTSWRRPATAHYQVDANGTIAEPVFFPVCASSATLGRKHGPDLVIMSGPLTSPRVHEQVLCIASQHSQHALLVGVCTHDNSIEVPLAEDLRRLYASYHAVLVVAQAQREQLVAGLIRTIGTLDEPAQWLACDWHDIRHMFKASGPGLVRYGSACHAGSDRAAMATADAISQIERDGPRLRTAHGLCIGVQSGSPALYGREIKEVLNQVRAAAVAGVTITLSAAHNVALEASALVVDMFAVGERGADQLANMDAPAGEEHALDAAAFTWTGNNAALDPLYPHACALVLRQQRASISLIQRHLHIGYGRASRLFEVMQREAMSAPDDRLGAVFLSRKAALQP